ncbi:MAG: hypothetical protein H0W73_02360 [Bacteroidetes bacterium]|nr:hypothetical protein [Bacteroidota bacterium]
MKAAGISDIKKELEHLSAKDLMDLCISLAKYKKDNKEYLGYLLFEAHNKTQFIKEVKEELDTHFEALKSQSNLYYVKKSLRKILRIISKYAKYTDDKGLNAELYIYFCLKLKNSGIPYHKSQMIVNIMEGTVKKINTLISTLHPDLQNDFLIDLEKIVH